MWWCSLSIPDSKTLKDNTLEIQIRDYLSSFGAINIKFLNQRTWVLTALLVISLGFTTPILAQDPEHQCCYTLHVLDSQWNFLTTRLHELNVDAHLYQGPPGRAVQILYNDCLKQRNLSWCQGMVQLRQNEVAAFDQMIRQAEVDKCERSRSNSGPYLAYGCIGLGLDAFR